MQKVNAFYNEFSSPEFSLSESAEIAMLSVIYLGIFFSLTKYLHFSKTLKHNMFFLF